MQCIKSKKIDWPFVTLLSPTLNIFSTGEVGVGISILVHPHSEITNMNGRKSFSANIVLSSNSGFVSPVVDIQTFPDLDPFLEKRSGFRSWFNGGSKSFYDKFDEIQDPIRLV